MKWWWQHPPRLETEPFAPDDPVAKPRILISLDRSWLSLLRINVFFFSRLVRRHGGVPLRVDYGTGPEPDDLRATAQRIVAAGDGLILSGGLDVDPQFYRPGAPARKTYPRRDRFELALIEAARERDLPVLGICRGCQLLNVSFGGTLRSIREDPRLRSEHHSMSTHPIDLEPHSRLYGLIGESTVDVRCTHGQIVDELGDGLQLAARARDGLPEAVELPTSAREWLIGVQWHPEHMLTRRDEHRLIAAMIERADPRMRDRTSERRERERRPVTARTAPVERERESAD